MSKLTKALDKLDKANKNLSETVSGITGTNLITVYHLLLESGVKFTQKDCITIALDVSKAIVSKGDKIAQIETWEGKNYTFTVHAYPETNRKQIEKIIVKYFRSK